MAGFPPGHEALAEVTHHLYHAMFTKNKALWDESGVTEALEDNNVDDDEERQRNAVLALAAYIHAQGGSWQEHFSHMSVHEVIASYKEFQ